MQTHLPREGKRMTFTMKKLVPPNRRDGSRPVERRAVACEALECRQLLSTGMTPVQAMPVIETSAFGGWESRWVEMAPMQESASGQIQFVTNLANAGLGANVA